MADLSLRRYEPADVDDVWALHERALRHAGAYDEAYAHLDADLRDVSAEYLATGGEFLLGERNGEVVAMGALQPSEAVDHHETADGTAVVRRLRVDPDHHREGYGSTVLAALEDRARDLGYERLVLDTTSRQTAAIGLFRAFDYEEIHRVETDAGVEVRVFEKEL